MLWQYIVCWNSGQIQYLRNISRLLYINKYLARTIITMAVSFQKDFIRNLECPVCLEVCTDPRLLPCPAGNHTVCTSCLEKMVQLATHSDITCPVCRAHHTIPRSGIDGFSRNLRVGGMIDALCKECRKAPPDVDCSHCEQVLCSNCQVGRQTFGAATTSIDKLHAVIQKGGKNVNKEKIEELGVAIEREIDDKIAQLYSQIWNRKNALKVELKQMIETYLESLTPWREEVDSTISAARSYIECSYEGAWRWI